MTLRCFVGTLGVIGTAGAVMAQGPPHPDIFWEHGWYQEAAWGFGRQGRQSRVEEALAQLEEVLRLEPVEIEPLGKGISTSYRLRFADGSDAFFKVDGSDPGCAECDARREVAVYELDKELGFGLTPMTLMRTVELPDGTVVEGSAMWWMQLAVPGPGFGFKKSDRMKLFDALIGNSDRHRNNWLMTAAGTEVAIDHNRAFQYRPAATSWGCWELEVDAISDWKALEDPATELGALVRRAEDWSLEERPSYLWLRRHPEEIADFLERRGDVIARLRYRAENGGASPPLADCAGR